MKRALLTLFFGFFALSLQSAELDKSRIKSEQSFIGKNEISYQGNVRYHHGTLNIEADKLVRTNNEQKKITVTGTPVEVTFVDVRGEETKIFAPEILYWEDSGEIVASGNTDNSIRINQTSKKDRLTLVGNKLNAHRLEEDGFSFTLTGNPTLFELQRPDQPLIQAQADSLSSNGKGRQTHLTGQVQLRQGDSLMAAASMIYDGETELISAQQSDDGSQRVETEFFWDKEKQQPKQDQEQP